MLVIDWKYIGDDQIRLITSSSSLLAGPSPEIWRLGRDPGRGRLGWKRSWLVNREAGWVEPWTVLFLWDSKIMFSNLEIVIYRIFWILAHETHYACFPCTSSVVVLIEEEVDIIPRVLVLRPVTKDQPQNVPSKPNLDPGSSSSSRETIGVST